MITRRFIAPASRGSRMRAVAIFVNGPMARTVTSPGWAMTCSISRSTPCRNDPGPAWIADGGIGGRSIGLDHPLPFKPSPVERVAVQQRRANTGSDRDVGPARDSQHRLHHPRTQFRIHIDGGDRPQIDLGRAQDQPKRHHVVDIGADIRIQNDGLLESLPWCSTSHPFFQSMIRCAGRAGSRNRCD